MALSSLQVFLLVSAAALQCFIAVEGQAACAPTDNFNNFQIAKYFDKSVDPKTAFKVNILNITSNPPQAAGDGDCQAACKCSCNPPCMAWTVERTATTKSCSLHTANFTLVDNTNHSVTFGNRILGVVSAAPPSCTFFSGTDGPAAGGSNPSPPPATSSPPPSPPPGTSSPPPSPPPATSSPPPSPPPATSPPPTTSTPPPTVSSPPPTTSTPPPVLTPSPPPPTPATGTGIPIPPACSKLLYKTPVTPGVTILSKSCATATANKICPSTANSKKFSFTISLSKSVPFSGVFQFPSGYKLAANITFDVKNKKGVPGKVCIDSKAPNILVVNTAKAKPTSIIKVTVLTNVKSQCPPVAFSPYLC